MALEKLTVAREIRGATHSLATHQQKWNSYQHHRKANTKSANGSVAEMDSIQIVESRFHGSLSRKIT